MSSYLWKHTLTQKVPTGAIPAQIDRALAGVSAPVRQVKLYNSGSFFDSGAIPPEDDAAIAPRLGAFARVIVESHPSLVGRRCLAFKQRLKACGATDLEVAMGLEAVYSLPPLLSGAPGQAVGDEPEAGGAAACCVRALR